MQIPAGPSKTLLKGLMALGHKTEITGAENLPGSGAHIYAFTHQDQLDAPAAYAALQQPATLFVSRDELKGLFGKAVLEQGAYPVGHGANCAAQAIEKGLTELEQGHSIAVFPERKPGGHLAGVHPLKKSISRMALESQADSIIPVAMNFTPAKTTTSTVAKALAVGAAVATAGAAVAMLGAPLAVTLATAATGAAAGAVIGAVAGASLAGKDATLLQRAGGALKGVALGAVSGAAISVLTSTTALLGVSTAVTGVVGAAVAWAMGRRGEARMSVGHAIPLAPYRQEEALHATESHFVRDELTHNLHSALSDLKQGIL